MESSIEPNDQRTTENPEADPVQPAASQDGDLEITVFIPAATQRALRDQLNRLHLVGNLSTDNPEAVFTALVLASALNGLHEVTIYPADIGMR